MVQGTVKQVIERPWGNKTMYSLSLLDHEVLYGFGPVNPRAKPGDKVEFEAEKNAKGYWQGDKATLKVVAGTNEVSSGGSSVVVAKAAVGKDSYWDRKESRDVTNDEHRELGATRNTAIEWIKLLISQEAFKLPPATKREDFFNALLADYILRFRGLLLEPVAKPAKAGKAPVSAEAQLGVEETVSEDDTWN